MRPVFMLITLTFLASVRPGAVSAEPIAMLAAENFYADIAQQIGGADVAVTSVLSNPDQDPHLFEASASVARRVAAARVVILNGLGYDPWMERLLAAAPAPGRRTLVVGDLAGHRIGDNPHIWYDLGTIDRLAGVLAETLRGIDPAHSAAYDERLAHFQATLGPLRARIDSLRARTLQLPIAATEPVFGYLADALGMDVHEQHFALAIMNGTEPSVSDVAAFQDDLKQHRVRLLIHNSQTAGAVASRMERLARAGHIPVLGVTETEPPGRNYQSWMMGTLDALDRALPPP